MLKLPSLWDAAGITVSALCLVHCLALSAFVLALPGMALAFFASEGTHLALALALIPISVTAFLPGWVRNRSITLLALAVCGLTCVLVAALLERQLGGAAATGVTVLGSCGLLAAHGLNMLAPRANATKLH
jgi:hypothetical protein